MFRDSGLNLDEFENFRSGSWLTCRIGRESLMECDTDEGV